MSPHYDDHHISFFQAAVKAMADVRFSSNFKEIPPPKNADDTHTPL